MSVINVTMTCSRSCNSSSSKHLKTSSVRPNRTKRQRWPWCILWPQLHWCSALHFQKYIHTRHQLLSLSQGSTDMASVLLITQKIFVSFKLETNISVSFCLFFFYFYFFLWPLFCCNTQGQRPGFGAKQPKTKNKAKGRMMSRALVSFAFFLPALLLPPSQHLSLSVSLFFVFPWCVASYYMWWDDGGFWAGGDGVTLVCVCADLDATTGGNIK